MTAGPQLKSPAEIDRNAALVMIGPLRTTIENKPMYMGYSNFSTTGLKKKIIICQHPLSGNLHGHIFSSFCPDVLNVKKQFIIYSVTQSRIKMHGRISCTAGPEISNNTKCLTYLKNMGARRYNIIPIYSHNYIRTDTIRRLYLHKHIHTTKAFTL